MPKLPAKPRRPQLVNRGPAGLLTSTNKNKEQKVEVKKCPARIAKAIEHLVVKIADLKPDPNNARVHPERNLDAIKISLATYGQMKPIVVRKQINVVVTGNGTLDAAKQLGWTKIAAVFHDMTDAEAAGYGLADNRSAELARWDWKIVQALEKIVAEANGPMVGWTMDEIEVIRAAEHDWVPPAIKENGTKEKSEQLVIGFTPDQYEVVGRAIATIRMREQKEEVELPQAEALTTICQIFLDF